jgi:hypothetical protein
MIAWRSAAVVGCLLAGGLTVACAAAGAPGAASPGLQYPGPPAARIHLGLQPGGLVAFQFEVAASPDAVWVLRPGELLRIDPDRGVVTATIPLDWGRRIASWDTQPFGLGRTLALAGDGSVWVVGWERRTVWRVDVTTNRIVARVELADTPIAAASSGDAVWVTSYADRGQALLLRRIDPGSFATLGTISLPGTEVTEDTRRSRVA